MGLCNDEHVWVWSWPKGERMAFSQRLKSRSFKVFVLIDTANSFVHSLASNQVTFSFGCFWFWWAFDDLAIFLPSHRLWKLGFSSFACWQITSVELCTITSNQVQSFVCFPCCQQRRNHTLLCFTAFLVYSSAFLSAGHKSWVVNLGFYL